MSAARSQALLYENHRQTVLLVAGIQPADRRAVADALSLPLAAGRRRAKLQASQAMLVRRSKPSAKPS